MKKTLLLMTMVLISIIPIEAQVTLGVKAGVNSTSLKINEMKSKNGIGFTAGPVLRVDLPLCLGFDIAALYEQKKSKIDNVSIKQEYVAIPANLRLNLPLVAGSGIYLAAGPQVSFNVGDDDFSWKNTESYERNFQLKKSLFSLNYGAGVKLNRNVELGFVYNVALGKTGEMKDYDYDRDGTKGKTLTIYAGLYF